MFKFKKLFAALALSVLASACGLPIKDALKLIPQVDVQPPAQATFQYPIKEWVTVRLPDGTFPSAEGLAATVRLDASTGTADGALDTDRVRFEFGSPASTPFGGDLDVDYPGYEHYHSRVVIKSTGELCPCDPQMAQLEVHLIALPPPIPPPPTRDEALNLNTTFQGLMVDTPTWGPIPMFEAALPWMSSADRQAVYAAKRAAGDTHVVIQIPSGPPLYDEPNQPYSPDRGFGPLDWTNGLTGFDHRLGDLVVELRQNGFIPFLFMQEDHATSLKEMPLAVDALKLDPRADLTAHVVFMPGWDGVFYGWSPDEIVEWGDIFRQHCITLQCYLGIEHQPGRIPVGEGGDDWRPGGRMTVFDVVLGEFNEPPDDTLWQVAGRTLGQIKLGGTYNRPPDQPAGDDPNPPWYFATGTPRGKLYSCFFEFNEYDWVRLRVTIQDIINQRAYGVNVGYSCKG